MSCVALAIDRLEAGASLYGRLLEHAAGLPNDALFARMLVSQATGAGALPPGLGLDADTFADLIGRHFPGCGPLGLAAGNGLDPARAPERADLVQLLLEGRAGRDPSEVWMAEIVAAACMAGDHLWQDLGLWSRADLNHLMLDNFPTLAAHSAASLVPPVLRERATAAYLGLAIGDALGATVEFMTPREIAAEYGVHDRIRGGGWLRLRPGQVTDDTGMALALGNAILAADGIDAEAIARAFDAWMRARPVDIGHTVRRGILHFRQTGKTEVPYSEQDAGNGAAMRVLPVALATLGLPEATVRAASRVQARVTHHNPLSDAACETLALMVQDALFGKAETHWQATRLHELIVQHPEFEFRRAPRLNPSGYVVDTLQAVFQGLFGQNDFHDTLVDVVNRGGMPTPPAPSPACWLAPATDWGACRGAGWNRSSPTPGAPARNRRSGCWGVRPAPRSKHTPNHRAHKPQRNKGDTPCMRTRESNSTPT